MSPGEEKMMRLENIEKILKRMEEKPSTVQSVVSGLRAFFKGCFIIFASFVILVFIASIVNETGDDETTSRI